MYINFQCLFCFRTSGTAGSRDSFHQVAQMMDSIMLDSFAPISFAKVTARPSRTIRRQQHISPTQPTSRNQGKYAKNLWNNVVINLFKHIYPVCLCF